MLYVRKQIDLLGNDFYLAHQYRALHWWAAPTHITVLGDLLGSQWIGDEEFGIRSSRFWNRVFKGASALPEGLIQEYKEDVEEDSKERRIEILGSSSKWSDWIINVAGNHDIGYAGDIDENRIGRFEAQFGPVNGDIHFTLPLQYCNLSNPLSDIPTLRLVVLNSMNLDSPAWQPDPQQVTYKFINSIIDTSSPVGSHATSTILLTHIPLHKESGTCVDSPFFSYFSESEGGGIKEQNMISDEMSKQAVLQGIFGKSLDNAAPAQGLGRDGIILTGHDHEGCDIYHFGFRNASEWYTKPWGTRDARDAVADENVPGLREVTVRSMMGEFGGHAALVAAWWDAEVGRWMIEVGTCNLGVQHTWWAVHIFDIIVLLTVLATAGIYVIEEKLGYVLMRKTEKGAYREQSEPRKTEKINGSAHTHAGFKNGKLGHKPAVTLIHKI